MLDSLITSKTRLKLLIKFFVSSSNQGHLRGLAEEFQESTNSIRKELNQLSEAGYLEKRTEKNKILYSANTSHSLFEPLQHLIHKFLGIDNLVDLILIKAGGVEEVSLVGDYARGLDSGAIEVLVLGKDINQAYLLFLAERASLKLKKEVHIRFSADANNLHRIVIYQKLNKED